MSAELTFINLVHDDATFAELKELFGAERLIGLLDSLAEEIGSRLMPPAQDADRLARDAHVIVSVSGALGFEALSRACGELEALCLDGADPAPARVRVAEAAAQAVETIKTLRAGLS